MHPNPSRETGSRQNMSCPARIIMQDTAQADEQAASEHERGAWLEVRGMHSASKSSAQKLLHSATEAQQLSANELDNNVIIIIKRLCTSPRHPPLAPSCP